MIRICAMRFKQWALLFIRNGRPPQGAPDFFPAVASAEESRTEFSDFIPVFGIPQPAAQKAVDFVIRFRKITHCIIPEFPGNPAAVELRGDSFGAVTLFGIVPGD